MSITSAQTIAGWTDHFAELPKELVDAIEVFEHLRSVDVGRVPSFDFAAVTVDNAESVIRDLAQQLALVEDKHDPLVWAKNKVLEVAASNLLAVAGAALPALTRKLAPLLKKKAQEYVDAVAELPDTVISPTELFEASAIITGTLGDSDLSHIVAYQKAHQKAKSVALELDHMAAWVASTRLVTDSPVKTDSVLLLLSPANAVELEKLDAARKATDINPALREINAAFFTAAKNGIAWGINLPEDGAKLRQELMTLNPSKR